MKKYLLFVLIVVLIALLLYYLAQQVFQSYPDIPRFVSLAAERQTRIARELVAEEHLND